MKLIDFYIAAFLPVITIATLVVLGFTKITLVSLLLYYSYRCILDYHKLKAQEIVGKKDVWKFIVPVHSYLYFRELYFRQ